MFGRRVLRTRHRVFGLEITFRREIIILTIASWSVVQESVAGRGYSPRTPTALRVVFALFARRRGRH